jgi:hypothetical protein
MIFKINYHKSKITTNIQPGWAASSLENQWFVNTIVVLYRGNPQKLLYSVDHTLPIQS